MLFLELAAQSVRGFSPSIRVALKPGYSALKSPTDLPAPLSGLILALAFPDGRGGDAAFLAPGAKAGRAGLSIQGHDGSVWRIVRDLGGSGGLHKQNKATGQFEVISQDALEMGQSLRAGAGFPARSTWEQLFTITGPQLPTRRPRGPSRAAGGPAAKTSQSQRLPTAWNMDDGAPAEDPGRLAALEAELITSRRAAEIQFRMDGINSELFGLESKVKALAELSQRVEAARAELKTIAAESSSMPDDIIARATRYPDERKRYEEQVKRIREEQQLVAEANPSRPPSLLSDQRFVGSMVGALVLFVGAMFLDGPLRFLALLSMLPFTFAALLALRYIEDLQHSSRLDGKTGVMSTREKKLSDEFEMTTMVVQQAFSQVNAFSLDEFLVAMAKRDGLQNQLAQLELERADLESDPEYLGLDEKVARFKAEQEECNQELLAMSGGYVRDVRDIEREIARIKEPFRSSPSSSGEGFAAVTTSTETWEDPAPPLMMIATDLFSTDVPSLWSVLHDRAVQYLTALTDKRYHGISVDKDGHATLEAPGRSLSARELPGKDLDLMYLALRLTLIEKAAAQHKLPVVIEDTFNTVFDAPKQPLFGRMVKHLGSLTQVLHVSGVGQNASLADTPTPI